MLHPGYETSYGQNKSSAQRKADKIAEEGMRKHKLKCLKNKLKRKNKNKKK